MPASKGSIVMTGIESVKKCINITELLGRFRSLDDVTVWPSEVLKSGDMDLRLRDRSHVNTDHVN